jgi:hypothetical protein
MVLNKKKVSMEKLNKEDLLDIIEYEKNRNNYRKNIIAYKKNRRISLGSNVTMVFENKRTLTFQIQEIMRAERLVHQSQIQNEIDVYTSIMPLKNGLSATLFLEVTEEKKIRPILDSFIGLSFSDSIFFQIGDEKVPAVFESGREKEDNISSVHYIKFNFNEQSIKKFTDNNIKVSLVIDFKNYNYSVDILNETRNSLINDLI